MSSDVRIVTYTRWSRNPIKITQHRIQYFSGNDVTHLHWCIKFNLKKAWILMLMFLFTIHQWIQNGSRSSYAVILVYILYKQALILSILPSYRINWTRKMLRNWKIYIWTYVLGMESDKPCWRTEEREHEVVALIEFVPLHRNCGCATRRSRPTPRRH